MNTTVECGPLRTFVEREPQLALPLLISARGAVHASVVQELVTAVTETHSPEEAEALERHLSMVTQVGATLQWATLAVGDEPEIERAVDIVRGLLTAGRATAAGKSRADAGVTSRSRPGCSRSALRLKHAPPPPNVNRRLACDRQRAPGS
jgi:Tetracyclin repressor-like, C-terminal domain